jgi:hypothetical protein
MALPKQVQAQLDAANRVLEQANNPTSAPPEAAPPDPAQPPQAAANEPQATPEPPESAAPAVTPPRQDEETWEARYKALKGMYNKQVPELQQQVTQLTSRLEEAIKRLDQASVQQPQQPPAPTADPQDVEAFGEDLVNMVKRTAERMFGGAAKTIEASVNQLNDRLAQIEKRLQGTTETVEMTAEQTFFDRLTKLIPNWVEINDDERFKAWCIEIDPMYGLPRQRALNAAQQAFDADRAAAVFRAYIGTQPATPKPTAPPVDTQVSPRAAASAPPSTPPSAKPVIASRDVDIFYRDVAQGKYRGREQEQQRIEALINDALAEGRIR